MHPVWQVKWIQQAIASSGQERTEALISVSADGRISKWFLCSDGLDCLGTVVFTRIWFQLVMHMLIKSIEENLE